MSRSGGPGNPCDVSELYPCWVSSPQGTARPAESSFCVSLCPQNLLLLEARKMSCRLAVIGSEGHGCVESSCGEAVGHLRSGWARHWWPLVSLLCSSEPRLLEAEAGQMADISGLVCQPSLPWLRKQCRCRPLAVLVSMETTTPSRSVL